MVYYMKGILRIKEPDFLVLEVGGIGFRINIPSSLYPELPPPGEKLQSATYLHVRDDELTLYGFSRPETRRIFTLVSSVAGIGPRVALNILGTMSPLEFSQAILTENHVQLKKVPGIGLKTSQRLVLELKEKLRRLAPELSGAGAVPLEDSQDRQEAMDALIALGYTGVEARRAVETVVEAGDDLQFMIKKALQYLGEK